MDKETVQQLTDECIQKLEDAVSTLERNLELIITGSRDLQEKHKLLDEWGSRHIENNRRLIIDLGNIVSPDLMSNIRNEINKLAEFPGKYWHYQNLIEKEFDELSEMKSEELERLRS